MKPKAQLQLSDIPLPQTDEIERQVIFDAMNNTDAVGDIASVVSEDMFTSDDRKKIWNTIVNLFNSGAQIDMPTIHSATGRAFIDEILTRNLAVSTATASMDHAYILRAAETKRRAYFAALRLLQASADVSSSEDSIISAVERAAQDVVVDRHEESEVPISVVLNQVADEMQERFKKTKEGGRTRVPTGFPSLDYYTYGGWGPGQLIILAARPSVGKTAIMLKFARESAQAGVPTCVFSIEMTNSELGQRNLYSTDLVSPTEVSSGNIDWARFDQAVGGLSHLPLYFNDHSKDVNEIVSRISINVRKNRCGIAFIDYLGLMDLAADSKATQSQLLGYITKTLKAAAKRLKIPIVLLCQLNRNMVRENRAPELTDLRDSGDIEQDADIVLMLAQKTDPSLPEDVMPDLDIWLRKNRQFVKDIRITVRPNGTYSNFYEVESRKV